MEKEELIIALIANDLVHQKLIVGLHQLNIDASTYSLYLSETIFRLLGYEKEEITVELCDIYNQLSAPIHTLDFSESQARLNALARVVYSGLRRL